jgi:photosystem I P700 chlorophyll a apoprotein A2
MQLGLALASLGATSLTAQHMYALTPYAYVEDFTTEAALYTHHQYIAGFLIWSFRSRCNLLCT